MTPYLVLSAAVFSIGVFGVLARRNLLVMLMSLELMLNGVNLALTSFSRIHGAAGNGVDAGPHGQVFVLMVMAVAAAEVAVGLALVIAIFRTRQTIDTQDLTLLKG